MTMHISLPAVPELQLWQERYPKFGVLIDQGEPPARALRFLGLSLWNDGLLEDAAKILTTAASLAPNEPMILGELGCLLCAVGRKAEAMHYLTASLKLHPGQKQVWLNVAGLCNETGAKDTAEQAFRAALDLDPTSAEAAAGLGLLYIERHRFQDAAQMLSAAVENGVTAMPVYACLGRALYLLGDFSNASVAYEKAARAFPDEAQIIRAYAQTRLIENILRGTVQVAAENYCSIAGRHAEDLNVVLRTAFEVLCGYGQKEAAIRLGRILLECEPEDPIITYHLDALLGQGHKQAPSDYLIACFDKYAPKFDRHLVEVLDYHIPDKLHPLLVETGMSFPRILDLGCGTGLAAPTLSSFGGSLTGVDISPGMLEKARLRNIYGRLIENEAIAYLSKAREEFDLIASLDVLIYFGDLTALFAAVAERLVYGGLFAFSFETGENEDYKLLASGRFAHDPCYIEKLYRVRFRCLSSISTTLRLEANRPVAGRLVLLQRE